jgi:hypothetical protein
MDEGLISRIYKEIKKNRNRKRTDRPINKREMN